jgi:hypothetical protein
LDETWNALAREAGLAAEHLGFGATVLSSANYAETARYYQGFFSLSVGLERGAKLALAVDYSLLHGRFPEEGELRDFGHDLQALLESVDEIAARRESKHRIPSSEINASILSIMSQFANNITRYYNLDIVTGSGRISGITDPIADWHTRVLLPASKLYVTKRRREVIERNARVVEGLIGPFAFVQHTSETGEPLNSAYESSRATGMTEAAQPHVRVCVLQFARFMGSVFSSISHDAYRQGRGDLPDFSDFFRIYNNSDAYFRGRKTWSIYKL